MKRVGNGSRCFARAHLDIDWDRQLEIGDTGNKQQRRRQLGFLQSWALGVVFKFSNKEK